MAKAGQASQAISGEKEITATGKAPYSAICALGIVWPNGKTDLGTGYIFGERTIFTLGHNLYDKEKGGLAKAISVTPGATGRNQPFGQVDVGPDRLRLYPGWTEGDDNSDFGAILLPVPLGQKTGWCDFAPADDAKAGTEIVLTGYPSRLVDNATGAHLMQSKGKIVERTGSLAQHLAKGDKGQSGGPIWRATDHFPYVMICGFHKGNHKLKPVNWALMLSWKHYDWAQARMRESMGLRTGGGAESEEASEFTIEKTRDGEGPQEEGPSDRSLYPEGAEGAGEGAEREAGEGASGAPADLRRFTVEAGSRKVEALSLSAGQKVAFTIYASQVEDAGYAECEFLVQDEEGGKLDGTSMVVTSSGEDEFTRETLDFEAPETGTYRLLFKAKNDAEEGSDLVVKLKIKISGKGRKR